MTLMLPRQIVCIFRLLGLSTGGIIYYLLTCRGCRNMSNRKEKDLRGRLQRIVDGPTPDHCGVASDSDLSTKVPQYRVERYHTTHYATASRSPIPI
mmetsp:Transcript_20103/g.49349  ORF Transcript_20103/g.49349 Transcript_20103/m.49349 type:complete len:96 (+) Transcript_20103:1473-1760(+)